MRVWSARTALKVLNVLEDTAFGLKDGYWNSGERVPGYVVKCDPKEACNGGRVVDVMCSTGYEGERCGKCAKDYYRSAGRCVQVPALIFQDHIPDLRLHRVDLVCDRWHVPQEPHRCCRTSLWP